ncbi:MAG TPA: 30S ribosomal protein S9 [Bdellovibrionales bacterium]|nr:MAG: 30S ribosomal protein S9 [Bdellovibrionales bacterium GWB1_52_6]OFZ02529.1 MAG: 30S ribosomal protein S9 [Bdellovibrionales bacterium GWA1_52_35]HAR43700.1 30S ribosomal protein S9 [Bdellovibrionales bacterium]HCM41375.1 30S ribosomal protein S9 [Bdellovibrionales bacterium]
MEKQFHQVGKRKNGIARVYLRPRAGETGVIRINNRSFENYFTRPTSRMLIMQPLELTSTVGRWDIYVNVQGGGPSGQAGAVKHGISRALLEVDPAFRPVLKKAGHITRDSREVERKKYGLAGARRRFQYSKR